MQTARTIAMVIVRTYPRRNADTPVVSNGAMKLAVAAVVTLALAVLPGGALALAPSATTGAASAIGRNTATIAGTVDPQGTDTTYHFEYGTAVGYGLATPTVAAGSAAGARPWRRRSGGLTIATTYHYRLVADNADGVSAGADRTFATSNGAPAASTRTATAITPVSATLPGRVDANTRPTTFHVEYGTTKRYGARTPEASAGSGPDSVAVSAAVGVLAPNVRYHYRVVASSAAGAVAGRDRSFRTLPNPQAIVLVAGPDPAPWGGAATVTGRVGCGCRYAPGAWGARAGG